MLPPDNAPLFATLAQLTTEWPNRAWSWDGRLPAVASSFGAALAAQAEAIALRALPQRFDAASLASAPAPLRAVVERSGGLRGSQLAFCDAALEPMAFGLWWPWGGGDNISLRVGIVGAESDAALADRLRALFGVQG